MKIFTIVGARPQFVKAAVLSRLIRTDYWKDKVSEILVHTGQHYDENMSDVFFNEMEIPKPDYNLNIGSGSHGKMTGEMLIEIENLLLNEKPDLVLVYGDTNSTLAGALAASKLNIPIAHVEAGLRSFWKEMPEEQNRILTDHISSWLFCPTEPAVENLQKEGIKTSVYNVGDIMLDANNYYRSKVVSEEKNNEEEFILATVHRAENTNNLDKLQNIIEAFNKIDTKIVLPLHPRTKKIIKSNDIKISDNIDIIDPIGFYEMLSLETNCKCIITDSGGVQKEAYFSKKPCITLREKTEWVETTESGWNVLVGTDTHKIINAYKNLNIPKAYESFYGNGNTADRILQTLVSSNNDKQ